MRWLQALVAPDWELAREHPVLGRLRAGDLLAAWAAHDLLHLRQLTGVMFALAAEQSEPFATGYAGTW